MFAKKQIFPSEKFLLTCWSGPIESNSEFCIQKNANQKQTNEK